MLLEDEYYCVGDEDEVKGYKRKLFFTDDDLDIKGKYDVLLPVYRDIVDNVLFELRDGDFFGFNLKRFLEGHKKAEPKLSQLKLSRELADSKELISRLTLRNGNFTLTESEISHQLDTAKKRWELSESEDKIWNIEHFVDAICDNLLIEDDLLKKGIGRIFFIKEEWFGQFIEDIANSPFGKRLKTDGHDWTTTICITKYEEYLRNEHRLEKKTGILEEKWAVMTYSGAYQHFHIGKNRKNEKRAIDRLINELYVRQLLDGEMPALKGQG